MNSREKNSIFIADFIVPFLSIFGMVMFFPILPTLQKIFGITISEVSWLPNIGYLVMILFSPVVGLLIKKFGTKPLLLVFVFLWIFGISIEILSMTILNYPLFMLGRFIEALGEASFFPLALSMSKVSLSDEDQKKSSSILEIGATTGGLVAALITGNFINSPMKLFVIPITLGIIVWIFILTSVKNAHEKTEKNLASDFESVPQENKKIYISLVLMIFSAQAIFGSIQVYLSYYMESFKAAVHTGAVLSLEQILGTVGAILAAILLKKFSFKAMRNYMYAIFIVSAIGIGMHISLSISVIFLALSSLFVGIAFSTLNIFLAKSIHTDVSKKMSIYTAIRFLGGFLVSLSWGRFIGFYNSIGFGYAETFKILYFSMAVLSTIIVIASIALQRDEKILKEVSKKAA